MNRFDGKHKSNAASRGLTAKIEKARDTAPDGADDAEILTIAAEAHRRNADPCVVWEEVK